MNNRYPFYIEREEHRSFAQQFRDMAEAMEIMEKLKKSGEKPKDDKKLNNGGLLRTWIVLGCLAPFIILLFTWLEITMAFDILEKAQALKVK